MLLDDFYIEVLETYDRNTYNFSRNECPLLRGGKFSGIRVDGGDNEGTGTGKLEANDCSGLRCGLDGGIYVEKLGLEECGRSGKCQNGEDRQRHGELDKCGAVLPSGKFFWWASEDRWTTFDDTIYLEGVKKSGLTTFYYDACAAACPDLICGVRSDCRAEFDLPQRLCFKRAADCEAAAILRTEPFVTPTTSGWIFGGLVLAAGLAWCVASFCVSLRGCPAYDRLQRARYEAEDSCPRLRKFFAQKGAAEAAAAKRVEKRMSAAAAAASIEMGGDLPDGDDAAVATTTQPRAERAAGEEREEDGTGGAVALPALRGAARNTDAQVRLLLWKAFLERRRAPGEAAKQASLAVLVAMAVWLLYQQFGGALDAAADELAPSTGVLELYVLGFAFVPFVQASLVGHVEAKRKRLQEAMRMVGLRDGPGWLAASLADGVFAGGALSFLLAALCAALGLARDAGHIDESKRGGVPFLALFFLFWRVANRKRLEAPINVTTCVFSIIELPQ